MTELRHREARVNGVRLHYVEADGRRMAGSSGTAGGPAEADHDVAAPGASGRAAGAWGGEAGASGDATGAAGGEAGGPGAGGRPPVILLHGFPEFWYSWRRQLRDLAAAGWRAVAPDQRGYSLSEKPASVDAYRVDELAADVAGLVRHLGAERAVVVGHDWGGAVAWHLARRRPDVVERLAVLNAPHPRAYGRELRTLDQLRRSWYVFFFLLPRLPEMALRAFDYAAVERLLRRDPVRPDAFTPDDVAAYKAALDRPGALTAALNWYRANLGTALRGSGPDAPAAAGGPRTGAGADAGGRVPEAGAGRPGERVPPGGSDRTGEGIRTGDPIRVPTLVIWGMRDRFLSPALLDGLGQWVDDLRVERLPDASHWVMADAPDRVSRLLVEFLERG